ncbi:MAG: hypothetical protein WC432_02675 [Candidatus Omnitrophota bacterium]|jgi:hypothetical protein
MYNNIMLKFRIFFLIFAMLSFSGCAYLSHPKETLFLKGMADNQKAMQAQLSREEKQFNRLKADLEKGRLPKNTQKKRIVSRYGEPVLCRPAEGASGAKESCFYRKPGGFSTPIILLDLDAAGRMLSWRIQDPDKIS